MFTKNVALFASVATVIALLVSASSHAAPGISPTTLANKLTFSAPVGLPGVTLGAGTYVFESGPGGTNPNIVRVLSQNRQRLFYQGFTIPVRRPAGYNQPLALGEAVSGEAQTIIAWFPVGASSGHEFLYR
jgi:hypothetical protein